MDKEVSGFELLPARFVACCASLIILLGDMDRHIAQLLKASWWRNLWASGLPTTHV